MLQGLRESREESVVTVGHFSQLRSQRVAVEVRQLNRLHRC